MTFGSILSAIASGFPLLGKDTNTPSDHAAVSATLVNRRTSSMMLAGPGLFFIPLLGIPPLLNLVLVPRCVLLAGNSHRASSWRYALAR
jgi:hypothetical protein